MKAPRPLRVAIAGASGFVGAALASRLEADCEVVALGRRYGAAPNARRNPDRGEPGITQAKCDLFSVEQTKSALEGAEVAVYLVHSMSPNARLTQARFEDLDLLLADNFARAAAEAGVSRIVYLGGLVPHDPAVTLSPHLASRLEVEFALGAYGTPVTAIRAGLVVGAEGSSLNLMVRLVERLPLMVCPSWTGSRTQPIALSDVIEILDFCCRDVETSGRVCEVGGPDVLSYREMMQVTARVLDRRRPMLPVPFVSPALSELWVSLVTGTSRSLVRPLIESLRHPMVVSDPWLQDRMGLEGRSFEQSLRDSLSRSRVWKRSVARSVQRFVRPRERDARWVAQEYPRWLKRLLPGILRVVENGDRVMLGLRWVRWPMLILQHEARDGRPGRSAFRIVGGLLSAKQPKGEPILEFRESPDGVSVLAVLQDFEPRLPWWLYAWTQAPLHVVVMYAYGRHLARMS